MGKIVYYRLWDKLKRSGVKQKDLIEQKIVSAGVFDRLRNNKNVNTESLEKLCDYLDCGIEDICEFKKSDNN